MYCCIIKEEGVNRLLEQAQIEKIKLFLVDELAPYFIILFGSTVEKNPQQANDIDLAFLSKKKQTPYELFLTAQKLASMLDKDVDLIDLNQASTVFQLQIIHYGKVIYCCDKKKRMEFEMKVYKMYAKLNEEREVIMQTIKEDGIIYGKRCSIE
ncbi:type VII toxin-antitoxin system MntA family adenylyltransferase antitoxin [Virgibacillus sp. W0181]|uniref:type VII toxin-antitoxin system MntA family adenylyltransferase antitoxin n=1 Tax=Virgibacillus sp. W0181 TaxID=3391581 RepID=UPI003F48800B